MDAKRARRGEELVMTSLMLRPDQREWLRRQRWMGGAIRALIDEAMQREREQSASLISSPPKEVSVS